MTKKKETPKVADARDDAHDDAASSSTKPTKPPFLFPIEILIQRLMKVSYSQLLLS